MTPQFHQTGSGCYDVVVDGKVVCSVEAEDGGWAVWAPETSPRPHHRLICVRDSRQDAAQAGLAYLEGQGRA